MQNVTGSDLSGLGCYLRGLAKNCRFVCTSEACNHRSYVHEFIRDLIIRESLRADVRRQCLMETNLSLEDVLNEAATYLRTVETDQVLQSDQVVDKMSSRYCDSHKLLPINSNLVHSAM